MLERPLAGALDDRPIGQRIAERDAEFDHARTRLDCCQDDLASGGKIGVATRYVGDERGFIFEMKGHLGIVDCRSKIAEVGTSPR